MNEKKYQIFISSTYKDLEEARAKIIETILGLYHFPVGMEMFSADDDEQWEIIQETISVSDYYIVNIGHRYGSIASDGVSYTEKEYDFAKQKGIPVLAFIRERDIPTKPHERDNGYESSKKLDAFIEKATSSKMCNFWSSIDDLATKVAIALPKAFHRKPQAGWVRGNDNLLPEELAKLSSENRVLRDKATELESLVDNRKPDIDIKINDKKFVEIKTEDMDFSDAVPHKLIKEDVPSDLLSFISDSEIEDYNNQLDYPDLKETLSILKNHYS